MELPQRKIIRLQGYDYSTDGAYFITMCVEDRHEILAQIVGDAALGVPCENVGFHVKLTDIGEVVKHYIENINIVYNGEVKLEKYVIMPNHVHMIIILNGNQNEENENKTVKIMR